MTAARSLTLLIADDEMLARRLIGEYLKAHADIRLIGECDNGQDAADLISQHAPDIVLLDIEMPLLSGLDVLDVTGRRHGIIFSTAYDQHALKAFELNAVDYLLKPYSQARFDEALEKARQRHPETDPAQHTALNRLLHAHTAHTAHLLIRDRGHTHRIDLDTLDYVQAEDDYITLHANGRSYMKTQSLTDLEAQLPPGRFVRIHRSYLIRLSALAHVERRNKDNQLACLHNGVQLPLSRSGAERLKELLSA